MKRLLKVPPVLARRKPVKSRNRVFELISIYHSRTNVHSSYSLSMGPGLGHRFISLINRKIIYLPQVPLHQGHEMYTNKYKKLIWNYFALPLLFCYMKWKNKYPNSILYIFFFKFYWTKMFNIYYHFFFSFFYRLKPNFWQYIVCSPWGHLL